MRIGQIRGIGEITDLKKTPTFPRIKMITEHEKQRLKTVVENYLKDDFDLYDFDADLDSTLSYQENYNFIMGKVKQIKPQLTEELSKKEFNNIQDSYTFIESQQQNPEELLTYEQLSKVKTIAIFGETGSGKTALAYKILEKFKDQKKIYFVKHPKPNLLKEFGYFNINNLNSFENLKDSVIYLDEPQLFISIQDKKSNTIISKLCSLARQRNNTLIISSSDTRVFGRSNEAYFDLWLIKDLDYQGIKNGSKIKNIVKDNCYISPDGFKLSYSEYISSSRRLSDFDGKHSFNLPNKWTDLLSKPYY